MPSAGEPLFLAEITAFDPALGTTRVLRVATGIGFLTKPSDTPANAFYEARITQPVDISRTMFTGNATSGRSAVGLGYLELANDDGALDAWNEYGFDGQSVIIRRSDVLNPAYATDFTTVLDGTIQAPEFTSTRIRFRLRDRQQLVVNTPFQTNKYLGSNILPDGLEGGADLLGKPKPVCYGVVKNVPAPCVNISKLIYQVNDGAIAAVNAVKDRGIALIPGLGSFTTSAPFGANTIKAMVAGVEAWVAVGTNGSIYSSTDLGLTWTARTSGFGTDTVNAVTYDFFHKFLAVGDNGKASTSPDGVTWTAQTTGVTDHLYACVFYLGANRFVAAGANGRMIKSTTGVTWTNQTTGIATTIFSLATSPLYIAFGTTDKIGVSIGLALVTYPTISGTGDFTAIAWTGNHFIAAGTSNLVQISTDKTGANWNAATPPFSNILALVPTVGYTLAVGYDSGPIPRFAMTQDEGVTWTLLTTPPAAFNALIANAGVMVGSTGARTASTDTYASLADLLDDTKAPLPGCYRAYPAGGYFRLGASPAGLITSDVTEGATAADRTAAAKFPRVLERAGLTSADYSASDLTTLAAANDDVLGYWTMDETTCGAVADAFATSVEAWWGVGASGVFRIGILTAPVGPAVMRVTEFKRTPERLVPNDPGAGIPIYKSTVRWGRFYQTMTTDLATGVTDAARADFAREWRDATAEDDTVLAAHPLAIAQIDESLLTTAADAQAAANRRLALRRVKRDLYEIVLPLNDETESLDFDDVLELVHPRFALSLVGSDGSNAFFRVIDVKPNAAAHELTLSVWGRSISWNRALSTGVLRITSTGQYRITTRNN